MRNRDRGCAVTRRNLLRFLAFTQWKPGTGLFSALTACAQSRGTQSVAEGDVMPTNSSNEQDPDEHRVPPTRPLVVLAEDNDETRRGYGLILRHFGYAVEEAVTGAEAVALTRALLPDLVLMDIGLPVMDGFQASRILKSEFATANIPLVAFSSRIDSTADLRNGVPAFDGFILKPVSPLELVRRVDAYLRLFTGPVRTRRFDIGMFDNSGPDQRLIV
jgi:two-component system cell cycle response regulator DivK